MTWIVILICIGTALISVCLILILVSTLGTEFCNEWLYTILSSISTIIAFSGKSITIIL